MSNSKVDAETAHAEFVRMAEAMDLDVSEAMAESGTEAVYKLILKAIMDGRLTVNDEGVPTLSPRGEDEGPLVFRPATGDTLVALTSRKEGESPMGGIIRAAAQLTGAPAGRFRKMRVADVNIVAAIVGLFTEA